MVDHNVMIAAKVSMLEHLVRDLMVDRFNNMSDPIGEATKYAETRGEMKPGAKVEPDLEPIRQGVWQQFLQFSGCWRSQISRVRKRKPGIK